jgi:hypothetical protein
MHPYHHALSSTKKHGGVPADYLEIHQWFDETKSLFGDARHRALRHHTAGIFWCEDKFGVLVTRADGKDVPVRLIAEQHVMEDMGFLPTPEWWLSRMSLAPEMNRVPVRSSDVEDLQRAVAVALYKGEG